MKKLDLLNHKFGNLTVIGPAESEKRSDGNGSFTRWKCLCECGKEKIIRTNNLREGVKSCGCLRPYSLPPSQAGFLRVYRNYKQSSEKRKRIFGLSEKQFKEITTKNCHYCGSEPNKISSTGIKRSNYYYNGIDRVDNNIGYVFENCVPCCDICNKAKHTKSYDEFLIWIDRLIKFRMKNLDNTTSSE